MSNKVQFKMYRNGQELDLSELREEPFTAFELLEKFQDFLKASRTAVNKNSSVVFLEPYQGEVMVYATMEERVMAKRNIDGTNMAENIMLRELWEK